jgi:hypothetical protein
MAHTKKPRNSQLDKKTIEAATSSMIEILSHLLKKVFKFSPEDLKKAEKSFKNLEKIAAKKLKEHGGWEPRSTPTK